MAFNRNRLSRVGTASGPAFWIYKTDDAAATVDTAGYFNDDGSPLKLGDVILRITVTNIDASNEATAASGFHIVNSVTLGNPTVIDIADVLALTATDTD